LGSKVLPFPDEKPSFELPPRLGEPSLAARDSTIPVDDLEKGEVVDAKSALNSSSGSEKGDAGAPKDDSDANIVDWYGPTDVENPLNWSTAKKSFTFFQICLLTFVVYSGSAIITPALYTFIEIYGVSAQVGTLTLSLYVLGYV
jgi:DHA1 family multidrug resistance protein-like MFS transporter